MSKTWFLYQDSKQTGPLTWDELSKLSAEGKIKPEDMVYTEGMSDWTKAENVAEIITAETAGQKTETSKRNKYIRVACLLATAIVISWLIAFFATRFMLTNSLVFQQAMIHLHQNDEAAELLGRPISSGSAVRGDGALSGEGSILSVSIPVKGSLRSGNLDATGVLVGNQWNLTSLVLTAEDGTLLNLLSPEIADRSPEEKSVTEDGRSAGPEWSNRLDLPEQGFSFAFPETWTVFDTGEELLYAVIGEADDLDGLFMIQAAMFEKEMFYEETVTFDSVEEMLEAKSGLVQEGMQTSESFESLVNQTSRSVIIDNNPYSAIEFIVDIDVTYAHYYLVGLDTNNSLYLGLGFFKDMYELSKVPLYEDLLFDNIKLY